VDRNRNRNETYWARVFRVEAVQRAKTQDIGFTYVFSDKCHLRVNCLEKTVYFLFSPAENLALVVPTPSIDDIVNVQQYLENVCVAS
jgi:hypothetical protein